MLQDITVLGHFITIYAKINITTVVGPSASKKYVTFFFLTVLIVFAYVLDHGEPPRRNNFPEALEEAKGSSSDCFSGSGQSLCPQPEGPPLDDK